MAPGGSGAAAIRERGARGAREVRPDGLSARSARFAHPGGTKNPDLGQCEDGPLLPRPLGSASSPPITRSLLADKPTPLNASNVRVTKEPALADDAWRRVVDSQGLTSAGAGRRG